MSALNKIIIISGASGSGKTTLVNYLRTFSKFNLEFSISVCTREKRVSEIDGQDYIFLSIKDFKKKISANEFLEWEEVYQDCFYGTLKSTTISLLNAGKNILFDVDVKGANSIKNYFKEQSLGIFIQAPSTDVAAARLSQRGTEPLEAINMRVRKISQEILIGEKMDYHVINDDLSKSKKEIYDLVNRFL